MAENTVTYTFAADVEAALQGYQRLQAATKAMGGAIRAEIEQVFGKQIPQAAKPAGDAIQSLGDKIQAFKREQVQQGRMVGFYVREIAELTGASRAAQTGMAGLGGAIAEIASGGKFAIILAGFELVKGAIGAIRDISKESEEQLKKFIEKTSQAVEAGNKAATGLLRGTKNRATDLLGGDSGMENARREAVEAAKAYQSFLRRMNIPLGTKPGDDNIHAFDLTDEQKDKWREMYKLVTETGKALRDYQDLKPRVDLMGKEFGPGNREGLETFLKDQKSSGEQAAKEFAEGFKRWLTQELRAYDISEAMKPQSWDVLERAKGVGFEYGQIDALNRGITQPVVKFPVFGGVTQKEKDDLAKLNAELEEMRTVGEAAGSAVANAFSAIGAAIGGAAGSALGVIGDLIQKVVQLAIAIATAAAGSAGPLGWLNAIAAAVGVGAALITTLNGVPKYETGTSYVPRTGPAILHQGEAVIPAGMNALAGSTTVNVTFNAPVDKDWWSRNQTHIVDQIRDATRNRRL